MKGKRITEMAAQQRRVIGDRPSGQSQRQHHSKQAFSDSDSTTKATTTRKKAKRRGRDRRSCLPLCVPQRRKKERLLVRLSSTFGCDSVHGSSSAADAAGHAGVCFGPRDCFPHSRLD